MSPSNSLYQFTLPQSYIYLYHTDEYFVIPLYPESVADNLESSFGSQNALSRTAPVFSYNNSGPRTVLVSLNLHRDMLNDVNTGQSNASVALNDDYVDTLIKKLQAVALPTYDAGSKLVTPPMVAVRFSDEIFVKGVVQGGISINYQLPLLENNKYAMVTITFTVYEIQPYDAQQVGSAGSFRGLTSGLAGKMQ